MAQAQRKLRENSNLQFPQGQHWSAWKRATVPLNDGRNIISRGQNQVGFTWKYKLKLCLSCVEFMNGELFNRTSQVESFTLEARAQVVAIMNHWKAESLGTAIMVIIKQL